MMAMCQENVAKLNFKVTLLTCVNVSERNLFDLNLDKYNLCKIIASNAVKPENVIVSIPFCSVISRNPVLIRDSIIKTRSTIISRKNFHPMYEGRIYIQSTLTYTLLLFFPLDFRAHEHRIFCNFFSVQGSDILVLFTSHSLTHISNHLY